MKTVFTDKSTIAKIWYNQSQSSARDSRSRFYFEGKTIYSYGSHFPIAKHVENKDGQKAILMTLDTYSNTTAKHIAAVRNTIWNANVIYCLKPSALISTNFDYWIDRAEFFIEKLSKSNKPALYTTEIERIRQQANAYSQFTGYDIPDSLQILLTINDKESAKVIQVTKLLTQKTA